ncbi:MAG: hypothetical protein A2408_00265 [Candidatus Yonathbacteria bacterium RIFOXYC1_FULL_52_10]|uniref:Cell division protein FtsX n=1 Tax=Candidatus Yonathbacteria bacterium RIFOXYD1_FULL_52_36 TaxID=1802730 RepID=A0A1G2SIB5_9BACT|nr:MAG: hypothetical protein A2408_00265 [Candidatus Yonathbacteria bacterium RIFOXYC1_FULL_52_10]OHA84827.1 MAG: hypothetical protein A2591_00620 [Candidatus Yonathbacteria bacterium RIFOXYD1_FULL_52_36]
MFFLNVKRIWKSGFVSFWRNGVVSLSAVLVMVVALFMIGSTILLSAVLEDSLTTLKEKVDINVYFAQDATDEEIQGFIKGLEALPEVSAVEYITRDQALMDFKERHANDQLTLQALDEVGDNPLLAYINVKADDPAQYQGIYTQIESPGALSPIERDIIYKVNYEEERNQRAIERLSLAIAGFQKVGFAIVIIFILTAALITYNTIRLTIYVSREEIAVMRLVGAENNYIRGPFIAEGVFYGIVGGILTIALFYPLTVWVEQGTSSFWGGLNLFDYYLSNFFQITVIVLLSGIVLGATASYMAVRKYLSI